MNIREVLVIEDDAAIRESLRELLELEGFRVRTAANGAEGMIVLQTPDPPCLILLDLMMPVMDGWQFLARLSADPNDELASIPVAVVSAASDLTDLQRRYGCTIIRKPLDVDRLLGVTKQHCSCVQ